MRGSGIARLSSLNDTVVAGPFSWSPADGKDYPGSLQTNKACSKLDAMGAYIAGCDSSVRLLLVNFLSCSMRILFPCYFVQPRMHG